MAIAILVTGLGTPAGANQPTRANDVSSPSPTHAAVFQLIFVDPISGNDRSGDGTQRSPLRSITRAVQLAQPNTAIFLAAGTYSSQTGEQFPIMLPPNVSLQENFSGDERGITIQGDVVGGQLLGAITTGNLAEARPAASNRAIAPASSPATSRAAAPSTQSASSFSALTGDYPPGTLPPNSQFRSRNWTSTTRPNTVAVPANPLRPGGSSTSAATNPAVESPRYTAFRRGAPTPSATAAPASTLSQTRSPDGFSAPLPQSSAAISIPVPPPLESGRYRSPGGFNTSQGGMGTASPIPTQPILNFQESVEIPVLAPAQQVAIVNRSDSSINRRPTAARPSRRPRYDLLPVPNPNVPLGNIGNLPTITVSGAASPRRSPSSVPVISRAAELGLRYRVVVNTGDRSTQERVLQLFPEAFLTYDDDRDVVIQVGAFNERDNAEDVETVLEQNGIRARVERVD